MLEPLRSGLAAYGLAVLAELVSLHLAAAHRHLGHVDVAVARAEEAAVLSRRTGARRVESAALLTRSQLAVTEGDDKRAEALAHEALAAAHEIRNEQWTGSVLEHVGHLALRAESHVEGVRLIAAASAARERLHRARGPFDADVDAVLAQATIAMGDQFTTVWEQGLATPLEDAVAYCRRARGERTRPSTGWDSLTPTERRVVDLVALGLTNPQIGERLFIGRGTVKTHLAHIFTKLGLANRAELAAEAVRHTA